MVVGSKMVLSTFFLLQREGMQEIFIIDLFLCEAPNFVFWMVSFQSVICH